MNCVFVFFSRLQKQHSDFNWSPTGLWTGVSAASTLVLVEHAISWGSRSRNFASLVDAMGAECYTAPGQGGLGGRKEVATVYTIFRAVECETCTCRASQATSCCMPLSCHCWRKCAAKASGCTLLFPTDQGSFPSQWPDHSSAAPEVPPRHSSKQPCVCACTEFTVSSYHFTGQECSSVEQSNRLKNTC